MAKLKNKYADETQSTLYTRFPSDHFLSNENNMYNALAWNTFFRRNLHRLAIDYLGIKLHLYQAITLYLMGISRFFVIIASRGDAKSFLIALYACCRCITRPYSLIVLSSGTKGQSKLIVSEKIKNELMGRSAMLRKEIKAVKDNQNDVIVYFRNHSTITVVPASENGRGHRSNCVVREEFRQIDKHVDDSILSPFQTVRQTPYSVGTEYEGMKEVKDESVDIYISSSWLDNGHWMWEIVDRAFDGMMKGSSSCLLAFDEAIAMKHDLKSKSQLIKERQKQDPLTWRIEFLNERVKENTAAFFPYSLLQKNQSLKKPFYPRTALDVRANKKNPYDIPKQKGEIRVVSCDMAFVTNKKNDNSVFSCMRLLPETNRNNVSGYREILCYLESIQGGDVSKQAVRIRQLYEDFGADYIVLDTRNAGRNAHRAGNRAA